MTINGTHIFVVNGQSVKEACDTHFKNVSLTKKIEDDIITLSKAEYAELCSAIRTKYRDKIPKSGGILYKNDLNVYNYNKRTEHIVCTFKTEIVGNERFIDYFEKENGK